MVKKKRKTPLCTQRRFLALFAGQALVVFILGFSIPPRVGVVDSDGRNVDATTSRRSSAPQKKSRPKITAQNKDVFALEEPGHNSQENHIRSAFSLSRKLRSGVSNKEVPDQKEEGEKVGSSPRLPGSSLSQQTTPARKSPDLDDVRMELEAQRKLVAEESRRRFSDWSTRNEWPPHSEASELLHRLNRLSPRNEDKFPFLSPDRVVLVLYVHLRPHFLRKCIEGLSRVRGINETLLIVSHDGRYPEMDAIVQAVDFCRVKQVYNPFSPHIITSSFPGSSPTDCQAGKVAPHAAGDGCVGVADRYGTFRSANRTSLKHHWWWLMNTVWDVLEETRDYNGHIMFLEEDIYPLPMAYEHIKALIKAKNERCPTCVAATLAPSQQDFYGNSERELVVERMGNLGYTFNRSVWKRIKDQTEDFCFYDDYNWDATLSSAVFSKWNHTNALRWSRASAIHFGSCGAHINVRQAEKDKDCSRADLSWLDVMEREIGPGDDVAAASVSAPIRQLPEDKGNRGTFEGWGGWGDFRDHALCEHFSGRSKGRAASS